MGDTRSFIGRFFDGKSAAAQTVCVLFDENALFIETENSRINWAYRDLVLSPRTPNDVRLGAKGNPDALLVLPPSARSALEVQAPEIFARTAQRRQFTALVAALIGGAAIVGAALFIGVPAASGPMARATPRTFETRIGANMAAQITAIIRSCKGTEALSTIVPVIEDLATISDVGFPITFQFINTPAPNAFALPGGQVMATAGLLDALGGDQEAFLAVVAHELGHVQARDGLRAFYRNAGLGVALEIITGGSGAAQQAVLLGGQVSQLRFTRMQEQAADETAFDILERAKLNPAALARAFKKIEAHAEGKPNDRVEEEREFPSWLSTHPNTEARIKRARERTRRSEKPLLSDTEWERVTNACQK